MSDPTPPSRGPLTKLHSWSPGTAHDEEAWRRRRRIHLRRRLRQTHSAVTDDDVDELRAWFELGFRFDDTSNLDPKLTRTFPALEIVTKPLGRSMSTSSMEEVGPAKMMDLDPKAVKTRLKQWAHVVACVVQQQSNSQIKIFSSSN